MCGWGMWLNGKHLSSISEALGSMSSTREKRRKRERWQTLNSNVRWAENKVEKFGGNITVNPGQFIVLLLGVELG